jgi:hypothetical protein
MCMRQEDRNFLFHHVPAKRAHSEFPLSSRNKTQTQAQLYQAPSPHRQHTKIPLHTNLAFHRACICVLLWHRQLFTRASMQGCWTGESDTSCPWGCVPSSRFPTEMGVLQPLPKVEKGEIRGWLCPPDTSAVQSLSVVKQFTVSAYDQGMQRVIHGQCISRLHTIGFG